MLKTAISTIAAVGAFIVGSSVASSDVAQAPVLTGKMADQKYLIGTWSCTTKLAATSNMPSQTIAARVVYWTEPQNVIASYYNSKSYSASSYMGWMTAKKLWWSNGADMFGGIDFQTGKDSGTNVREMTGTSWYQGKASTTRDTVTKISDTTYQDAFEAIQGDKVTFQGTATCAKTSAKTM